MDFFSIRSEYQTTTANTSEPEEVLARTNGWLGYRGATIGAYGTLSQLTGLDHRALLPPTYQRAAEKISISGHAQRLHPESAVFNEGWAVPHYPVEDDHSRPVNAVERQRFNRC